ncbi:hypothetical protein BGZ97_002209, partial [Linnemannia gamsii]
MSAATPHGTDNSHSASIQIDPPAQPVPSTTTATPFPLPTHLPRYNDDDGEDSGDEDGPLLGASSGGPSGRRHHQQISDEPAPFLYRLHDWLADLGNRAKLCWLSARSMKAPLSGWRKLLKWILIFLGIVLVLGFLGVAGWLLYEYTYVCAVNWDQPIQLQYSFSPEQYKSLNFHLDNDAAGTLYVTQSNEPYENDGSDEVLITVNARGSSGDILRAVTLGAITNPEDSSIEANVYLDMFDFDRERAFRKGCLDISVHVVLPANMTHFESLKVHHRSKGNVYVDMSRFDRNDRNDNYGYYPEPPAPTVPHLLFDRLDIKVDDGYVSVVGTGATEELKVVSAQGRLFGHVFANKRVEVESKQHTTLTVISTSSDLDLKASAETVAATVKKTRQTLTGYFPFPNGTEPEGHLPRIEISGVQASLA